MPWLVQFHNPHEPSDYDPQEMVFCCEEHAQEYANRHTLSIRNTRSTENALSTDRCQFCGSKDLT